MTIEVSVKLSNEESKFTKKSLCYETDICLSKDDPKLVELVRNAQNEFKGVVDDILITFRMVW
jgi:hypothetical protein